MVKKIFQHNRWAAAVVLYSAVLITSCHSNKTTPDVSSIKVEVKVERFERDLFALDTLRPGASLKDLKTRYGSFFDLFAYQITSLGSRDSLLMQERFRQFVMDTNFRKVYSDVQAVFGDLRPIQEKLTKAFRYYKYYFPKNEVPQVLTLVSAFSYPIIADSSHLAIGLDMYMGPDYHFYNTLEPPLPMYLRNRMRPEYVAIDALRGWAQSDYSIDESQARMLDIMISQGRILYFLDKIFPESPDSLKLGYSSAQTAWCFENEAKIWSFFVDQQLLFSNDPNLMMKYVNDGPTTNGFSKESPGNIGQFLGWQIVKAYMESHSRTSLRQLMDEKDLMKIYRDSRYKPQR